MCVAAILPFMIYVVICYTPRQIQPLKAMFIHPSGLSSWLSQKQKRSSAKYVMAH